jgi:hypothetical protein
MLSACNATPEVRLNLGGSVHDPTDTVGRLLFNVLATVIASEGRLISARTRVKMKTAKAKGRLCRKQPKLSAKHPCWRMSVAECPKEDPAQLQASSGQDFVDRAHDYIRTYYRDTPFYGSLLRRTIT